MPLLDNIQRDLRLSFLAGQFFSYKPSQSTKVALAAFPLKIYKKKYRATSYSCSCELQTSWARIPPPVEPQVVRISSGQHANRQVVYHARLSNTSFVVCRWPMPLPSGSSLEPPALFATWIPPPSAGPTFIAVG